MHIFIFGLFFSVLFKHGALNCATKPTCLKCIRDEEDNCRYVAPQGGNIDGNCVPFHKENGDDNNFYYSENDTNSHFMLNPLIHKMTSVSKKIAISLNIPKENNVEIYLLLDSTSFFLHKLTTILDAVLSTSKNTKEKFFAKSISFGMGLVGDRNFISNKNEHLNIPTYRHLVDMTKDSTKFEREINQILEKITEYKGSFANEKIALYDAISQVVLCDKKVGWTDEPDTIRLIVAMTKSYSKVTTDAYRAGVVQPFKEECGLNADNIYDPYTDYSNDEMLYRLLKKKKIVLLLISTNFFLDYYENLFTNMGNSYARVMRNNSYDIKQYLRDAIKNGTKYIRIGLPESDKYVTFTDFKFNQTSVSTQENLYNKIDELPMKISIGVRIKRCFLNDKPRIYELQAVGIKHAIINISTDCEKECSEGEELLEDNIYENFICNNDTECKQNEQCLIDTDITGNTVMASSHCKKVDSCINTTDIAGITCNGRGDCEYGSCVCHNKIAIRGKYCEEEVINCLSSHDYTLCSGSSRGKCINNACVCLPGYMGSHCEQKDCQHFMWNNVCRNETDMVCSSNGVCNCVGCDCDEGFTGTYCQHNKTLLECETHFDCVLKNVDKDSNDDDHCSETDFSYKQTMPINHLPNCFVKHGYKSVFFYINPSEKVVYIKWFTPSLEIKKNDKINWAHISIAALAVVFGKILAYFIVLLIKYQYDKYTYNRTRRNPGKINYGYLN